MSHLQAVLPIAKTINAASFPGITQESRETVQRLLQENRKHHIFFNHAKFHNHFVHHVLDAYALGCSPERLTEIYNCHKPTQRAAPPKLVKITQDNWKNYIEKAEHWTAYVEFFLSEVEKLGIEATVSKYFFLPEFFGRAFSAINHAIIHLGFGLEFQLPLIVAEGLALTLLESPYYDFIVSPPPTSNTTLPLLELFEQVRTDSRFNKGVAFGGDAQSPFLEYLSKWEVKETDIAAKEKELFELIVLLYAASVRPNKRVLLDFFLTHSLTGSVFVHEFVKQFSGEKGAAVLKGHFAVTLMYYIMAGRPILYTQHLRNYTPAAPPDANPWLDIVRFGIETNDSHATKAVYALLQGEAWFGDNGTFLKAAQMTADAFRALPPFEGMYQDAIWCHSGVGFDQSWEGAKL